jgi:hypothetical protein
LSHTPDAIGWNAHGASILIECKSNKPDFLQDKYKTYRRDGAGLGNQRYFLTPKGLVKPTEVPEGWGLLEVEGDRIDCVVRSPVRVLSSSEQCNEKLILMSLVRRIKKREFLIIRQEDSEGLLKAEGTDAEDS